MKRTILLVLAAILITAQVYVAGQSGPYASQIQAAIRSLLNGQLSFTGGLIKLGALGDAGISRTGPGVIAFGNGTAGNGTANLIANAYTTQNGGGAFAVGGRSAFLSTADKLAQLEDNANVTGIEFNVGTPTLGTCTGGTLTSGSHNFGGEVTGTTGGSCVINFGVPNFTNAPLGCVLTDEGATPTALQLSARSAASITVANITSGHSFTWFCPGRIGT